MPEELIAGRYRLLEPLGRGAMSSVWLAEDQDLGRRVAVKTLAPTADRARFEREARAAAALSHPNICGLYDYGEAEGKPFMVLELLPGGSLEEQLRSRKPLPDEQTEILAAEIAAGLAHAHERGLVHRDLKPANILFDSEGRAKIADFGIARMGDAGTLTEVGTVLGTASYISPEQAAGLPAAAASDVYSFGVILFRMLTGRLPFVADNALELVRMHRDEPPPAVADLRADAPPRLAGLADAALAKDPAARPPDGDALLAALGGEDAAATALLAAPAAAGGEIDDLAATRMLTRTERPPRRGFVLASVVTALLLFLGAGLALALLAARGGGSHPVPNPSLPSIPTAASTTMPSTSTTVPSTAAMSTTAPTTTAPTTTHAATTAATTSVTPPVTTLSTTTFSTTTSSTTTAVVPTAAVTAATP